MSFSDRIAIFLKSLTSELLEFFAASQFLPLILLLLRLTKELATTTGMAIGHMITIPARSMTVLATVPLWVILGGLTTILYGLLRIPRFILPQIPRWSVRKKASIMLTVITIGYMIVFVVRFLQTRAMTPSQLVATFGLTIGAVIYGFGIRYIVNKLIKRQNRPDFYARPQTL